MIVAQETQEERSEVSKSQAVRLIDIFFIAPFLAYIGYKAKGLSKPEVMILYAIAGSTLYYNARNYLDTKKAEVISRLPSE